MRQLTSLFSGSGFRPVGATAKAKVSKQPKVGGTENRPLAEPKSQVTLSDTALKDSSSPTLPPEPKALSSSKPEAEPKQERVAVGGHDTGSKVDVGSGEAVTNSNSTLTVFEESPRSDSALDVDTMMKMMNPAHMGVTVAGALPPMWDPKTERSVGASPMSFGMFY